MWLCGCVAMWLCGYQNFKSSNLPKIEKSIACFLIDMKFISKPFKKFRRQSECQEIPRLRLFMIFKNSTFPIINNSDLQNFKSSNFEISNLLISKFQKSKSQVHRTSGNFEIPRFSDIQNPYFQGCSHIFLYFSNIFIRNTGSQGPLRVQKIENFGSSQNHPKSIGI